MGGNFPVTMCVFLPHRERVLGVVVKENGGNISDLARDGNAENVDDENESNCSLLFLCMVLSGVRKIRNGITPWAAVFGPNSL